jgi:phosphoribosylformylglycinamidine cyclo-ligase
LEAYWAGCFRRNSRRHFKNHLYTDKDFAENIISLASTFNIDAQIIGRVEESEKKGLVIEADGENLIFS